MGNLIRVLTNRGEDDSIDRVDIFVDFENCKPTENEQPVWDSINKVMTRSQSILELLEKYGGAANEIRDAISNPKDDVKQRQAWEKVVQLSKKMRQIYDFAVEMMDLIPTILTSLCSSEMSALEHLEKQQALFKQFAEILHFILHFDDVKMKTPSIQNDFSYYRRMKNRVQQNNRNTLRLQVEQNDQQESTLRNSLAANNTISEFQDEDPIPESLGTRISIFYGEPIPMLKMLSDTTTEFMAKNQNLSREFITDCFAAMAHICRDLVDVRENRSRVNNETVMFCLRVMTGVIILYDHVHPNGAFAKTSKIDVKSCIRVLKDHVDNDVEGLKNAIKYSSRHINDEETPKAIKQLLV